MELLAPSEFPPGFSYPPSFVRVADMGVVHLEPWHLFDGDALREKFAGLATRYPTRSLVPFAYRQDNDDVACWDLESNKVAVIHDFAGPGWEQVCEFQNFHGWLRQAIEDLIEWQETEEWDGNANWVY